MAIPLPEIRKIFEKGPFPNPVGFMLAQQYCIPQYRERVERFFAPYSPSISPDPAEFPPFVDFTLRSRRQAAELAARLADPANSDILETIVAADSGPNPAYTCSRV